MLPLFREALDPELNAVVSDNRLLKFLRARDHNIEKAAEMITGWWHWWRAPLPGTADVCPCSILDNVEDPKEGIYEDCPHLLHGEDKEGRPLYYEKTGVISANFSELKKHVSGEDELVARHVRIQEISAIRLLHQSKQHNKNVGKVMIVFDMTGLNMKPDLMALQYFRKMLSVDQNYYPETLHRMFVINAPWFFTAIYALVSPWIDPLTAQKIRIVGSDYLPVLREYIDDSNIPDYLGGTMSDCVYRWPYSEKFGISPDQIREAIRIRGGHLGGFETLEPTDERKVSGSEA